MFIGIQRLSRGLAARDNAYLLAVQVDIVFRVIVNIEVRFKIDILPTAMLVNSALRAWLTAYQAGIAAVLRALAEKWRGASPFLRGQALRIGKKLLKEARD